MNRFWDDKTELDAFWRDSDYFTGTPLTDDLILKAEKRFGYKLPEPYLQLLRIRNGGSPRKSYFHVEGLRGWPTGYFQVDSLRGIGHRIWGIEVGDTYPRIGPRLCDTPSGGHDAVLLDYSQCGRQGEPRVVHAVQGCKPSEVTFLAPNFAAFILALSDRLPAGAEDD